MSKRGGRLKNCVLPRLKIDYSSDVQDAEYDGFGYCHELLVDRLFSKGYKVNQLTNSFQKFYGGYPDLIAKYKTLVKDMLNDLFPT